MLPDLLRFEPLLAERPWGGRRLAALGRSLPTGVEVGESWEIADLPVDASGGERCTLVAEGDLTGLRLVDLIDRFGAEFMGSAGPGADGRFPLLVKLLDARENLSVQVHPPDDVAETDPSIRAKSESWYVLQAVDGARLWLDVRADVSDARLADVMSSSAIVDVLGELPAHPGDFHHIPAGRVHALGAGVMVFEIQTPSDTTFRIYDWTDTYGRLERELHPDQALQSIVRGDPAAVSIAATSQVGRRMLVETMDYWVCEHHVSGGDLELDPRSELRVLMVVAGSLRGGQHTIGAGEVVLLPASSGLFRRLEASPGAVVLEAGIC